MPFQFHEMNKRAKKKSNQKTAGVLILANGVEVLEKEWFSDVKGEIEC